MLKKKRKGHFSFFCFCVRDWNCGSAVWNSFWLLRPHLVLVSGTVVTTITALEWRSPFATPVVYILRARPEQGSYEMMQERSMVMDSRVNHGRGSPAPPDNLRCHTKSKVLTIYILKTDPNLLCRSMIVLHPKIWSRAKMRLQRYRRSAWPAGAGHLGSILLLSQPRQAIQMWTGGPRPCTWSLDERVIYSSL